MSFEEQPKCRLVGFRADDGVGLSGALFEPRKKGSDAVVYLHGNGDSSIFRSSRTNALASVLVNRGIAFFPFDNRGSGLVRWLGRKAGDETEFLMGGMAHELIRDCSADIDGALRFVRRLGYRRVHLAGHSTGANKVVLYHYGKPRNTISSYALLAPGDDTGLYYRALGPKRFPKALERCRREIRKGRGETLAPGKWSPFPISFRSLYDTLNPDGEYNIFPFLEEIESVRLSTKPLFREFSTVRKRMLIAYGSEDEFCYGDAERCLKILLKYASRPDRITTKLFEGADHGFHGSQEDLGEALASSVLSR